MFSPFECLRFRTESRVTGIARILLTITCRLLSLGCCFRDSSHHRARPVSSNSSGEKEVARWRVWGVCRHTPRSSNAMIVNLFSRLFPSSCAPGIVQQQRRRGGGTMACFRRLPARTGRRRRGLGALPCVRVAEDLLGRGVRGARCAPGLAARL